MPHYTKLWKLPAHMQRYCFDRYFIGLHKNDPSCDRIPLNYTSFRVVGNNQKQQKCSKVIFIRKENLFSFVQSFSIRYHVYQVKKSHDCKYFNKNLSPNTGAADYKKWQITELIQLIVNYDRSSSVGMFFFTLKRMNNWKEHERANPHIQRKSRITKYI